MLLVCIGYLVLTWLDIGKSGAFGGANMELWDQGSVLLGTLALIDV